MDSAHTTLVVILGVIITITVFGLWKIFQALRKDEAIDAATFLALRELRERFERTNK